jgi:hypothetical protein
VAVGRERRGPFVEPRRLVVAALVDELVGLAGELVGAVELDQPP